MSSRLITLLLVLVAALMFAACGGDDDGGSDGGTSTDTAAETTGDDDATDAGDDGSDDAAGGQTLELSATGTSLDFDKTELTASAGSVTLHFTNDSSLPHNVAIETEDGETLAEGEIVGQGGESQVTVDLEPGTYTYYCSPHKDAGMVGTLTVT